MMSRYKGRQSAKDVERDFPYFVDIVVPPRGLGKNWMQCTNFMFCTILPRSVATDGTMTAAVLSGGALLIPR